MCGIAGYSLNFLHQTPTLTSEALFKALAHRGPDGYGVFQDDQIALIHARLSIIDLSEDGNQPIYNEDRSLVMICNGEIYNYQQIRQELIAKGHRFSSFSDSEVIVHLYEESQKDIDKVLQKLTGMFAFAIWDTLDKKLVVARDRMGIKPLYFSHHSRGLAFCSEILPLIKSEIVSPTIDPTSLYEYLLLGSIPEPNTYFEEVKALAPGHYLSWQNQQLKICCYWSLADQKPQVAFKNMEEVTEALDDLLDHVIQDHLIADVPVGAFLSAGIDSSLIAYYAAKHQKGIQTFTASFPGEPEDEAQIANQTAFGIGAQIHNYEVKADFFEGFDQHFANIDQPFGISSALSLSRISREAQKKVKVVLSGDGADEIFAGYERHQPFYNPPYFKNLPDAVRALLFENLGKISGKRDLVRAADYIRKSKGAKYREHLLIASPEMIKTFIPELQMKHIDTKRYLSRLNQLFNEFSPQDPINQLLYVDLKSSLVDEMLTKADRMTMHAKIEGRVPFLDHRVVEFGLSIPSSFKVQNGFGKMPLRSLVEKYLGKDLAFRQKTGFNSPIKNMVIRDEKTRNDFIKQIDFLSAKGILQTPALDHFKKEIDKGNFHPSQIFSLYALSKFQQQF